MRQLDIYDVIAILGLILLTVGFSFVYAPLVAIVPGALLLIYGVLGSVNNGDAE